MPRKYVRKPSRRYRKKKPSTYRRKPRYSRQMRVGGPSEIRSTATYKKIVNRPIQWRTINGDLPERIMMKMRYNDAYINFNPLTTASYYSFRLNSIYAPDTSGSNQPALHDAMATLYTKYKVNSAKVKLTYSNKSASRTIVGLIATDKAVSGSFTPDIIQRSSNVSAIVDATSKDTETVTLNLYVNLRKLAGPKYHDSVYTASFGASPTDVVWLYMPAASLDGVNNVQGGVSVEITYYTEMFESIYDRNID